MPFQKNQTIQAPCRNAQKNRAAQYRNTDTCFSFSLVKKGNQVYLQAGAGIVADSIPENEYQECCNKVMALAKTLVEEE